MPGLIVLPLEAPVTLGLSTLLGTLGSSTSGKGDVVDDGDWKVAKCSGAPLVTRPFSNEGDVVTKIVRQPVQQDLRYRNPLPPGALYSYPDEPTYTAQHGSAILFDETEPRDLGGHKGEWIRSYATVPPRREVPESYNFAYQFYTRTVSGENGSAKIDLDSFSPGNVASKVVRDYFLLSDLGSYLLFQPPRFVRIGPLIRKVGDGDLHASMAGYWFISDDPQIVAEPSVYEIWHFPIYCRKTRYVPAPNDAFWGEVYTIPSLA